MTEVTTRLNRTFLEALGPRVLGHADENGKPLDVDLAPPLPQHIRLYMYSLVEGGPTRRHEYKAVLRTRKHDRGEYKSFEHGGHRLTLLCAYRDDLGVFVLWDAALHPKFKNGGNTRVARETVLVAATTGWAVQRRHVRLADATETIYACEPRNLERALREGLLTAGGEPAA